MAPSPRPTPEQARATPGSCRAVRRLRPVVARPAAPARRGAGAKGGRSARRPSGRRRQTTRQRPRAAATRAGARRARGRPGRPPRARRRAPPWTRPDRARGRGRERAPPRRPRRRATKGPTARGARSVPTPRAPGPAGTRGPQRSSAAPRGAALLRSTLARALRNYPVICPPPPQREGPAGAGGGAQALPTSAKHKKRPSRVSHHATVRRSERDATT